MVDWNKKAKRGAGQMQQFILGLFLILVTVLVSWLTRRARAARSAAAGAPVTVGQAAEKLKEGGAAFLTVRAPIYAQRRLQTEFAGKSDAAYYETQVLTISGKEETPFYVRAAQGCETYLQDAPGGEKLWVDVAAFGGKAELLPTFREKAVPGSELYKKVEREAPRRPKRAPDAYRVLEGYLPCGTFVTLRARVARRGGKLFAQPAAKGDFLTYRSSGNEK